jgi:outer membrane protein insertion porin family
MSRRPAFSLFCVLHLAFCILHGPVAAHAQAPQPEPTVVEVVVEQEGQPITDPNIMSLIETKVGQPLSMQAVKETIGHLISLNRYEDAQAIPEPLANGIRLKWLLFPLHPVDRIEFTGMTGLSEGDLRRIVRERFSGPPTEAHADEAVELLRAQYRRHGYPNARVMTRIEPTHNPDRATLIFQVDSGMRAMIADLRIEQVDAGQGQRSNIVDVPEIKKGQPYDEDVIDRQLQKWEKRMHDRGFYEARASKSPAISGTDAFLFVNLARGPHVVVAFSGDPIPDSEKDRLVPVKTEASADEDLLEDSSRAIESYLNERGYRDASALYAREERDGELIITFKVTRGSRYILRDLRYMGNPSIPTNELEGLVRLKNGEPFVRAALDASVQAIRNTYRARGFTRADVKVNDAIGVPEDPKDPDRGIEITLAITEGPRTTVRDVTFEGSKALSEADLQRLTVVSPGRAYVAAEVVADRDRIAAEYRNRGYLDAAVASAPTFAEQDAQADVRFTITEGPQVLIDHIIIVGNQRTKTSTIENELTVHPGEPLGEAALAESRSNLYSLQLFRRATIEPVAHGGEPRRDLLIRVEEAPATVFGLGGGVEGGYQTRIGANGLAEDQFEVAPRGSVQIGRRNLFGKNRTVNFAARVGLRSRNQTASNTTTSPLAPATETSYGFHEYRIVPSYREPRILGTRSNLQFTGIVEQVTRTSYNFRRRELRGESDLFTSRRYRVTSYYSLQRTNFFDVTDPDDQPLIDRLFPTVRLSKFSGTVSRDSRDDVLDPSLGTQAIFTTDVAARAIGSEVGYVRSYLQGFVYRRLPVPRRMVIATGARVGLAHGFPRTQDDQVVRDLPASERFYAGGDNSVRGFPLDRLVNEKTITASGFPTGGNGVIVLNAELRTDLFGRLQGAAFVDAGNVFVRASEFSLTDMRPAAGFGVMFKSPYGLVRADLGFNLDRRHFANGVTERGYVVHFLLGQPF